MHVSKSFTIDKYTVVIAVRLFKTTLDKISISNSKKNMLKHTCMLKPITQAIYAFMIVVIKLVTLRWIITTWLYP